MAAAAGITGSCGEVAKKLIPYVIPPDDGINPVEGWQFATTCRMCEAGCGIIVRTVNGRAKKVEGNPAHPINHGGVCAIGQAAVQQLYHPERITAPLKRNGKKGTNSFTPTSWEEALGLLANNMKKAKGNGAFVMASGASDLNAAVASRVLRQLGSSDFIVPGVQGIETYRAVSAMFGEKQSIPYYDISQASTVLLLGADIFESGFSPTHYGWAYGTMRRGDPTQRGVLMYAGPRISMTAANADTFIPVKHGALGIFALAVSWEVLQIALEGNLLPTVPRPTLARWFDVLERYSPEKTGQITGAPPAVVKETAKKLVNHPQSVVMPGDEAAGHTNGLASMKAAEFLNMVLQELGRNKGTLKPPPLPYADEGLYERMKTYLDVPPSARAFESARRVLSAARASKIALGMVVDADPIHSLPQFLNARDAFEKLPFLASFSCFLNDTTAYADVVLPTSHFLESWSAQVPDYPYGVPIFNMQQPVVDRMYDTMSAGDAMLKAASTAGLKIGVENTKELIVDMVGKFRAEWSEMPPSYTGDEGWKYLLQKGGRRPENGGGQIPAPPTTDRLWEAATNLEVPEPSFTGDGEYHLIPYQTVNMADGRSANLPWMLEMPEPMTTVSWGSWVEINPQTAKKLGVENGDVLKVESHGASIEAAAYIYPGIGPDSVALPLGFGHDSFGNYASKRGAHAVSLLSDVGVKGSGELAWKSMKVTITKTGKKASMVRAAHPKGEFQGEVFQL
jgi:anaerobic selenocysteine-containing dehydrogenase